MRETQSQIMLKASSITWIIISVIGVYKDDTKLALGGIGMALIFAFVYWFSKRV